MQCNFIQPILHGKSTWTNGILNRCIYYLVFLEDIKNCGTKVEKLSFVNQVSIKSVLFGASALKFAKNNKNLDRFTCIILVFSVLMASAG